MSDMSADLAKNTHYGKDDDRKASGDSTTLDSRYRQIGISAVAAAARYQGGAKNPAYAPASSNWRNRIAEAAA
jgi:hypothetical protein